MRKLKKNRYKKAVAYDGYSELEEKFEKIDKIVIEILGKSCPEFAPLCPVCKGYLIYNRFKNDIFKEYA
jgi:hypothetical protein